MAVTLCPWCQSEIPVEEGQEPDKYCPVCDNEIDGYRTLTIDIGDEDEEEDDVVRRADEDDADDEQWEDAISFRESGPDGLLLDETTDKLLDEQEFVPECPSCREFMLEVGEQIVEPDKFQVRVPRALGKPVLDAPFALTLYVCPACFATQTQLSESGREQLIERLAESDADDGESR